MQAQVDNVKGIMLDNLNKVLERDENLQNLSNRSNELEISVTILKLIKIEAFYDDSNLVLGKPVSNNS